MSRWLLALLLVPSHGGAQVITGNIVGSVVDETGGVLPSAAATLTSTAIISGSLSQRTNDKGQFRFMGLAPGFYDLRVEADGFRTSLDEGIRVEVGATAGRRVELLLGVEVSVRVSADTQQLDTRRSGEATHYGEEYLENVPVARWGAFDLVRSAPGMAANKLGTQPTIVATSSFGSATNENLFILDGTDYTDPEYGAPSAVPSLETIQEIEIISTGASAEYGNYQGAIINMVSRQGGNEVRVDATFYAQPASLAAAPIFIPCFCPAGESAYIRDKYYDVSAQVGGPVARDRAWFYGTARYFVDADNQPGGDPQFFEKLDVLALFGKLNWQLSPNVQWLSSLHFDDFANRPASRVNRPFETGLTFDGHQFAVTLADITYVQSQTTLWDFRASVAGGPTDWRPNAENANTPAIYDQRTDVASGGPGQIGNTERSRLGFKAKGSHYATGLLRADHNFIFGAQLQLANGQQAFRNSGGMRIRLDGGQPVRASFRDPWTVGGAYDNVGLFLEDSLQAGQRLTLNLGIRYDRSVAKSPEVTTTDGAKVAGLGTLFTWNVVAPRLGFVFDLSGDGTSVVRGSWGRYYAGLFTTDLGQAHPAQTAEEQFDWDPATGDFTIPSPTFFDVPEAIDSDTRPASTDQISIGFEHEIAGTWVAGVSYVGKRGRDYLGWREVFGTYGQRVVEDPNGAPITVLPLESAIENRLFALGDRAESFLKYDALVATLQKRFSSGWQMYAHYTWADGTGFQLSNDGSPGFSQSSSTWGFIGAGKDPNNDINAQGTVSNDRTHMFRVQANGVVPKIDVGLAANFQYLTGFPYGPFFRVQLPQGNFPISFESPGSRRLESQSVLDVRVSKIFRFGNDTRVEILADIFNLFNESAAERIVTTNVESFLFELGSEFVDPRRVMLGVKVAF